MAIIAQDGFTRTVTGGLGTAEIGGPWTAITNSTLQSTNGSVAQHNQTAVSTTITSGLLAVSAADADVVLRFSTDKTPTGGGHTTYLGVRYQSSTNYLRCFTVFNAAGTVNIGAEGLTTAGGSTAIPIASSTVVSGLTRTAGQFVLVRWVVTGTAAAGIRIRGRAWLEGSNEPSTWTVDSTTSPGAYASTFDVGALTTRTFVSSSATADVPVLFSFDDLLAVDPAPTGTSSAVRVRSFGPAEKASSAITTTLTLNATPTPGNRLLLAWGGTSTSATAYTVTDSRGNTWTTNYRAVGATVNAVVAWLDAPSGGTALVSGDTITITPSDNATNANGWLYVEEWSGLAGTPTFSSATATSAQAASGTLVLTGPSVRFGMLMTTAASNVTTGITGTLGAPWTQRATGDNAAELPANTRKSYAVWTDEEAGTAGADFNPALSASGQWVAVQMASPASATFSAVGIVPQDSSQAQTSSAVVVTLESDTTPPSVPLNLRTTAIGSTSASLAWDASTDNVAVTGYEVTITPS